MIDANLLFVLVVVLIIWVNGSKFVRFEFIAGMLLNVHIFMDVTPCHWLVWRKGEVGWEDTGSHPRELSDIWLVWLKVIINAKFLEFLLPGLWTEHQKKNQWVFINLFPLQFKSVALGDIICYIFNKFKNCG